MDEEMDEGERCETCRFFRKWSWQEAYCQRLAPAAISHVGDDYALLKARWPMVNETNWCGEYQSKDHPNVG